MGSSLLEVKYKFLLWLTSEQRKYIENLHEACSESYFIGREDLERIMEEDQKQYEENKEIIDGLLAIMKRRRIEHIEVTTLE